MRFLYLCLLLVTPALGSDLSIEGPDAPVLERELAILKVHGLESVDKPATVIDYSPATGVEITCAEIWNGPNVILLPCPGLCVRLRLCPIVEM